MAPLAVALALLLAALLATRWPLPRPLRCIRRPHTWRRQPDERARPTEEAVAAMEAALAAMEALAPGRWLPWSELAAWRARHPPPPSLPPRLLRRLDPHLARRARSASEALGDLDGWRTRRNQRFLETVLREERTWFDTVFHTALTPGQRRAVVVDEDCTVAVAAAGTGKSSTLLARAAWLVHRGSCRPEEILVVAYNAAVRKELRDRLEAMGLGRAAVHTFHSLGYAIHGHVAGRRPAVSHLAWDDRKRAAFLSEQLWALWRERPDLFERWFVDMLHDPIALERYDTREGRLHAERALRRTITGHLLRSQAEVRVANALTLFDLRWEYERPYPHAPPSPGRSDYTPDFHLPAHDLWIEVWAVDGQGRTAPTIDAERYLADMRWKRELHARHGTRLLEIDQDDVRSLHLAAILRERLARHGVPTGSLDPDGLRARHEDAVNRLATVVEGFHQLFRAGAFTLEEVRQRANHPRDHLFLDIYEPVARAWRRHLDQEGKIDFADMLHRATAWVAEGRFPAPWRAVLVDEAQDLAHDRLALVRAVRDAGRARLFLVGDDWQSIYRFSGADLGLFLHPARHAGPLPPGEAPGAPSRPLDPAAVERVDLDVTFRLGPALQEATSRFVTRNPAQLRKAVRSARKQEDEPPIVVHLHPRDQRDEVLRRVLDEIARRRGEGRRVLLLARYHHELDALPPGLLERVEAAGLQVHASTVHAAKGMEADHVVVLGLDEGTLGFPSRVADDSVLRLVTRAHEDHPDAEERRLFYVALTRTRGRVYLLGSAAWTSAFVTELLGEDYAEEVEVVGRPSERHRCPRCHGMTIRRRIGRHGVFWSCQLHPLCDGRLVACEACEEGAYEPVLRDESIAGWRCTACRRAARPCPACRSGVLRRREGRYGPFLGCSNWRRDGPSCRHTESLPPEA